MIAGVLLRAGAAILALTWAADGFAQPAASSRFRSVEINLHAGGLLFDGPLLDGETRPLVGVRVGYNLSGSLGFGGNFDWARRDFAFETVAGPAGEVVDDVYLYSAELDYTFNFPDQTRFFLGGGVGAATVRSEAHGGPDDRIQLPIERGITNTHLHTPLAAGLKWFNRSDDPSLAFRMEVRDDIIWLGDSERPARNRRFEGFTANNVEVSAGISFLVGDGR